MSDVVLAILNSPEVATSVLSAASQLCSLAGEASRLNVLAPREQAQRWVPPAEMGLGQRGELALSINPFQAAFESLTQKEGGLGARARWSELVELTPEIVAERGARSDFVVTELPRPQDTLNRRVLRAALFGTDRPVLVVPATWSPGPLGQRVAVAWRNDKQAARAVIPVLRWPRTPDAVLVLMGLPPRAPDPEVPRVFVEHGVRPEVHRLPLASCPFGETLLAEAEALGADLLVMGAYAHAPLRELILGGTTRHVLEHTRLPVLMRH